VTSRKLGRGLADLTGRPRMPLAEVARAATTPTLGRCPNLHLLLGVSPRKNLYHVLSADLSFREVAVPGPCGVCLIPGPSGVTELADLRERDLAYLVGEAAGMAAEFDLALIDTAAGISRMTTAFVYAARELIMVTTPDLTAMTDAYATVKTALRHNPSAVVSIVVNRALTSTQGWEVFQTLDGIAGRFLGRRLCYLGYLPDDETVRRSVAAKVPATLMDPQSAVARRVGEIGRTLFPAGRTEELWADEDLSS
jgi:flagellar biosynthesis protein FlhG